MRASAQRWWVVAAAGFALVAVGVIGYVWFTSQSGPASQDPVAVLRQSVRRLSQTTRSTVTYDVRLQVETDREASSVTVQAVNDTPSTVSTGSLTLARASTTEEFHFVLDGQRLFLAPPAGTGTLWKEVDLLQALRSDDDDVRLLGLALQRPTALAAILHGVQSAEALGRETAAGGIAADHYRARVSFASTLARLDPTAERDTDLVTVVTERIDGEEIEIDAWVDANRRLRSLSLSGTLDGGRQYTLDVDFLRFTSWAPSQLPSRTTVVGDPSLSDLVA